MRISYLSSIPIVALLLGIFPIAVPAQQQSSTMSQPSKFTPAQVKDAVKTALKSVDLTLHQKRDIAKMVQAYEQQTTNADDATKQAAQKTLLKNIYAQLTPAQQTQFKASIKQSLSADIPQ